MTKNQIKKIIEENSILFIYLQFSDILGAQKNIIISLDKLDDVLEGGNWFDGSSVEGFARIAESDMLLRPDLDTFAILPWSLPERRAARFICDIYLPSGRRLLADPRFILQKQLDKAEKLGFDFQAGIEFEFYLFERAALPELKPHDNRSYFDSTPHSRAASICELTMKSLSAFSIRGEAHHHEVGSGQHEIDIRYDRALKSADNVFSMKGALKAHSSDTELKATWMPKPIFGLPGNGLHVHQSLWRGGRNVFYDNKNKYFLSKTAMQFLAGQIFHANALSAIVSPTVNSYKRLVSGYEAPVYICWGQTNRSALIRIPRSSLEKAEKSARLEYRAPDASSNPYLALAALLAAGLDGIEKKMTPLPAVEENVYEMDSNQLDKKGIGLLPGSLGEAIEALEEDKIILDIFGSAKDRYLDIKKEEWRQFLTQVSPWEIDRYL